MIWAFTSGDYYEKNVIYFLDKIIKKYHQPILFDVGANYGYYSLRYSRVCKQVISFEPVTDTYKVLSQNIKTNNIINIVALKTGLSDITEEKTINLYSYEQIMNYFNGLNLIEFSLIPDNALEIGMIQNASTDLCNLQDYACGCFWFKKPNENHGQN